MSTPTQAVTRREEKLIEYIPFGEKSRIRLSIEIVKNTLCTPTKSGKYPEDKDIIGFMMMCQAQTLNPYCGDAYLVGYDSQFGPKFSKITAHQALLKRAELHPDYAGMECGIIVADEEGKLSEIEGDFYMPNQKVLGGWARVHRISRKDFPTYRKLRVEAFAQDNHFWKDDAAGMICKCAEADALRSAFPTTLGGMYIAEENNRAAIDIGSTVAVTVGESAQPRVLTDVKKEPVAQIAQPVRTPQQELESTIIEAGFTFDQWREWVTKTAMKPIDGADSLGSFKEVKEADAKRLLRATAGMLDGIKKELGL